MLEIACFNAASALTAVEAGADRIELCSNYAVGGVTPSLDSLGIIRNKTAVPVNVMIRPRPGDFVYSDTEFEQMKSEIRAFKLEASGFVFGILHPDNRVDEARTRELVNLAAPLPCTFHRAFDQIPDMAQATEQLIACGLNSILTSGGSNAVSGADEVAKLHRTYGSKIQFILGGGIRSTNIVGLSGKTNVRWYHSAAITEPGEAVDANEVTKLQALLKLGT